MKTIKYPNDRQIIKKGINVLFRELGPVHTRRFIEISRTKREESVKRHRKWQEKLNEKEFIKEIFS